MIKVEQKTTDITKTPLKPSSFTRRAFFGAIIGLVVLAVDSARTPLIPKIETENGEFYMLYDRHTLEISPEKWKELPDDLDLIWAEGFELEPDHSAYEQDRIPVYNASPRKLASALRPELLAEASARNIPIALGDVHSPIPAEASNLIMASELLAAIPLWKGYFDSNLPRGRFLQAIGLWAFSNPLLSISQWSLMEEGAPLNGLQRFLQRLHGLNSHLHPENPMILYRNAAWAHKLLTTAQQTKQEIGKKPKILVGGGSAHSGTEDFLKGGQDLCQTIIRAYQPALIKNSLRFNGGLENFCSVRSIKVQQNPVGGYIATEHSWLVDQKLKAGLSYLMD